MTKKALAFALPLAVLLSSILPAAPALAANFRSTPTNPGVGTPIVEVPGSIEAAPALAPALTAPQLGVEAYAPQTPEAAAPVAASVGALVQAAAAQSVRPTLLGRLSAVVAGNISWTKAFDGAGLLGIRPLPKPVLKGGSLEIGEGPSVPSAGHGGKTINVNSFDIPGARTTSAGGVFEAGPKILNANVSGSEEQIEASIQSALLKLVDGDVARWGVGSSELETVHVKMVKGHGDQADTIYAYFRQQAKSKNVDGTVQNVRVHGSYLSFTVKIVNGKAVLMAAMARLYPNISAGSDAGFPDEELKSKAAQQLPQNAGLDLSFVERKVIFQKETGRWRTVNLYDIEGTPFPIGVNVAVDVHDGEVFAWDGRVGAMISPDEQSSKPAQQQGPRFVLHYGGRTVVTAEDFAKIQAAVEQAGGKVVGGWHGRFSNNILIEGDEAAMTKVAQSFGWSIEPEKWRQATTTKSVASEKSAADPFQLKGGLASAQAALTAAGVSDAKLFEVSTNLHNKSNIRAYHFYSASQNKVLSVLVDFLGHATVRAFIPLSDHDYSEISLDNILSADRAVELAKSEYGVEAATIYIGRRQGAVGPHPTEYEISSTDGKKAVFVAEKLHTSSLTAENTSGPAAISVVGQGEHDDQRPNGKLKITPEALPYIDVVIDGKKYRTDTNGQLSVNIDKPTKVELTLSGRWVKISDQDGHDLKVTATLMPGQPATLVFNPEGQSLSAVNQIDTYIQVTRGREWWLPFVGNDKRIAEYQIPANVNINDECNAYYTPGRPSLNFFKESSNCSDTGRPYVPDHEHGHFVDDMLGGINNSGMSEGWGDIGVESRNGTPIIGEGFLKNQTPSWIRNGENNYQYHESDEEHDQGQAWMGFYWKLRKALQASLGEAEGATQANWLVMPTMLAKATDIPSQMAQVLLNSMDKSGKVRFEKEIRAAAKAHGIELPRNPGIGDIAFRLTNRIVSSLTSIDVESVDAKAFAAQPVSLGGDLSVHRIVPLDFKDAPNDASATAVLRVNVSRFNARGLDADAARQFILDAWRFRPGAYADVKLGPLQEKRGVLGSEIVVELTGSRKAVGYVKGQVEALSKPLVQVPTQASAIQTPTGPMRFAPNDDKPVVGTPINMPTAEQVAAFLEANKGPLGAIPGVTSVAAVADAQVGFTAKADGSVLVSSGRNAALVFTFLPKVTADWRAAAAQAIGKHFAQHHGDLENLPFAFQDKAPDEGDKQVIDWKTEITAGALWRGRIKSALIRYCEENDIEYTLNEDHRVLDSTFYLKVKGQKYKIDALYDFIQRLTSEND